MKNIMIFFKDDSHVDNVVFKNVRPLKQDQKDTFEKNNEDPLIEYIQDGANYKFTFDGSGGRGFANISICDIKLITITEVKDKKEKDDPKKNNNK